MQYATFRDRMARNTLVVDKQGVKARFWRKTLCDFFDLAPYVIVGLYGWYVKGLRFNDLNSFGDFIFISLLPQNVLAGLLWYSPAFFSKSRRTTSDYLAGTVNIQKSSEISGRDRFLAKIKGGILAAVLLLLFLASGGIVYMSIDRPLDPDAKKFFYDDPFRRERNFFAAWAGLNAPSGEKDTYNYGLDVVEGKIDPDKDKELHFKGKVDNLCYQQKQAEKDKTCATTEEISKLHNDNAELLSRYEAIYRQTFKNYSVGDKFSIHGSGQDILNLQRLLAAEWAQQAKTANGGEALEEWLVNTRSLQRVLEGKMGIIEHAIWMIAYGTNLNVLPVILESNPSQMNAYKDNITSILDYDFMKTWDVAGMTRADFNWQYPMFQNLADDNIKFKKNDTRNKLYNLAEEMIALSTLPARQISAASEKLRTQYNCGIDFRCMHYNPVGNILISGQTSGAELFVNGHRKTAYQRMLLLWIDAKSQNLPGSRMADFVKGAPETRFNPLTDTPFGWNETTGSIYYEWKNNRTDLYY